MTNPFDAAAVPLRGGVGGSYTVQPDGTVDRTGGTVPHPDGDAPRTADGQVILDGALPAPPAKPAKPAKKEA